MEFIQTVSCRRIPNQVSDKHLQSYLEEFQFRSNRRKDEQLFLDTLTALVDAPILPFAKLTAETPSPANDPISGAYGPHLPDFLKGVPSCDQYPVADTLSKWQPGNSTSSSLSSELAMTPLLCSFSKMHSRPRLRSARLSVF